MAFLLGFGFSLILIPAARRIGSGLHLVDRPGSLKIHRQPVSVLGGAAVVLSTLGAFGIADGALPAGLVAAIGLALVAGTIDDARQLSPWVRLALLGVAGLALGMDLVGPLEVGTVGVVALVLVCSNAVNIIDGQDGLAGGLAAIASLVLAAFLVKDGDLHAGLGFALGGSLLGFLLWNRPPARIFLGNGGAYGVGIGLAVLATENVLSAGWRGVLVAGACLGVFACEFVFTVARRLRLRRPLTGGDRSHTYDLLADAMGSRAKSTFVFWGLGCLAGALALAADALSLGLGVVIVSAAAGASAAIAFLFWRRAVDEGVESAK